LRNKNAAAIRSGIFAFGKRRNEIPGADKKQKAVTQLRIFILDHETLGEREQSESIPYGLRYNVPICK